MFRASRAFSLPAVPNSVTEEKISLWNDLGLDLHYVPKFEISERCEVPEWYELPHKQIYREMTAGKVSTEAVHLPGRWLLIERFSKPHNSRLWLSKQELGWLGSHARRALALGSHPTFRNDPLQAVLAQRGWKGRTCLSFLDIQSLRTQAAAVFCVDATRLRLPKFAEYNFLGNVWYPEWKTTNTWEWLDDRRGHRQRLVSGSRSVGIVGWDPEEHWSARLLFRFVVEA